MAASLRGKVVHGIRITVGHEMLYTKICLLAKKTGFAWATNEQLSQMVGYKKDTISHLITDLYRIGWIYRRIDLDEKGGFVGRLLVPLDKLTPNTEDMDAKVREMERQCDADGIRNRLCHNGAVLGITPIEIRRAIYRFGAERIEELLCIIRASNTCKSPRKFFYAGLQKIYIAGARAKSLMGRAFLFERPSISVEQRVIGNQTIEQAIKNASAPMDPFFAKYLHKPVSA